MAVAVPIDPVKLVVAALYGDAQCLEGAVEALCERFGPLDFRGEEFPFDVTDYYRTEMGDGLRRRLLAFRDLVAPDVLPRAKLETNALEERWVRAERRTVNLDVGYLDHHKLVLGSLKPAGQKIYLGSGVWADPMFRYAGGRLKPFEWTFPDFRDGRYERELLEIRAAYMKQLRG